MANEQVFTLFSAQTVDGSTASPVLWAGGAGVFTAYGTFGAGTCKLQWSPDNATTWLDVDRAGENFVTLTAAGSGLFTLPSGLLRANLAGSTGASVTALVRGARA
jgi:hypothetical protein